MNKTYKPSKACKIVYGIDVTDEPKCDYRSVIGLLIYVFLFMLVIGAFTCCDSYMAKHAEERREEYREYSARRMQESFNRCKFEHDY